MTRSESNSYLEAFLGRKLKPSDDKVLVGFLAMYRAEVWVVTEGDSEGDWETTLHATLDGALSKCSEYRNKHPGKWDQTTDRDDAKAWRMGGDHDCIVKMQKVGIQP